MHKWILGLALVISASLSAQERTHHVTSGETLYRISKNYGVTIEALTAANPFLSEGLKEGQDLVIPNSTMRPATATTVAPVDTNRFDVHIVQPKETLYSLSREWELGIEEIIRLNPFLEEGLKVGQQLKLPKGTIPVLDSVQELANDSVNVSPLRVDEYTVLPGETIYSIARNHSITEEEFLDANAAVRTDGLKAGMTVYIPKRPEESGVSEIVMRDVSQVRKPDSAVSNVPPVDRPEQFVESQARPKMKVVRIAEEDSWTTLERKYHTTRERIIELNPETMNGLVVGRYIIVPTSLVSNMREAASGEWAALATRKVHFALALPLFLEENDSLANAFNRGTASAKMYPQSQFAFDFYSGLKLAIDTLRQYGLEVEIDVYDTRNDPVQVREISRAIAQSNAQFVLGPLYSRNAEEMARQLPNQWIVSPLSRTVNTTGKFKLIQAVASREQENLAIAHWINEEARDANVIFVRRNQEAQQNVVRQFMHHLEASEYRTISQLTMGEDLLTTQQIRNSLAAGKRDVFVLLDDDPVLMTSFINGVGSIRDSNITVVTTGKLLEMRTMEVEKLNSLDLYMSDVEFIDYHSDHVVSFLNRYRKSMKAEPSRFAYHGYDVGIYFLGSFALNADPEHMTWVPYSGLIKRQHFVDHAGQGPYNDGVYMLHLEDFIWMPQE